MADFFADLISLKLSGFVSGRSSQKKTWDKGKFGQIVQVVQYHNWCINEAACGLVDQRCWNWCVSIQEIHLKVQTPSYIQKEPTWNLKNYWAFWKTRFWTWKAFSGSICWRVYFCTTSICIWIFPGSIDFLDLLKSKFGTLHSEEWGGTCIKLINFNCPLFHGKASLIKGQWWLLTPYFP